MNNFPVIVISHINNCELASYFRNECDWSHSKDSSIVTGTFSSLEDIANHIVKLDREFFDEVHNCKYHSDFQKSIANNINQEHDPRYEYSHLIISKDSFSDENFGINSENGHLNVPTDWELQDELLEMIYQKKKAATANRLEQEKKQKEALEQEKKQKEELEKEKFRLSNEEREKKEYARLKEKYGTH